MTEFKGRLNWIIGGALVASILGVFGILFLMPTSEVPTSFAADGQSAEKPAAAAPASDTSPGTKVRLASTEPTEPADSSSAAQSPSSATATEPTFTEDDVADIRQKLKKIAVAFHQLHDSHRSFTPRRGGQAQQNLSWRVYLLPYVDQLPLFRRFNLDEPWDSANNLELLKHMPEIYRTGDGEEKTRFVVLTGKDTLFQPDRPAVMRMCRDGTSNTILLMHAGSTSVPWTKPEDVPFDPENPLRGVSPVREHYEMALVDASLLSLPASAGGEVFAALVTPYGGEIIDGMGLRSGRVPKVTGRQPVNNRRAVAATQGDRRVEAGGRGGRGGRFDRGARPDPRAAALEAERAALASVPLSSVAPQVYSLAQPGFTFAYDDVTGHLIVAEHDQNQVSVYRLDDGVDQVSSVPGPARPTAVAVKHFDGRSYFAVGGKLDGQLELFDARDGSRVGAVDTQVPTIVDLGGSRAEDDPYIYYAVRNNEERRSFVGRLDVSRVSDDGFLSGDVADFEVSADGTMLYTRRGSSPSGFTSMRIVPRDPQSAGEARYEWSPMALEQVHSEHRSNTQYVPDPYNALVADGKEIYSATLAERLGEFEFPVMCFLPQTPWVFGVTDGKLYVGSVNDKRTIVAIQLPEEFTAAGPPDHLRMNENDWLLSRIVQPIQAFADARRQRIIVATKDRVVAIDVKALKLPDEPLLTVGLDGPKFFSVNKPVEMSIQSYDDRVTTRLLSIPDGMKWDKERIRWTPSDMDIGDLKLLVERRFGRFHFEQTFVLPVRRNFVSLPIDARFVSLSPDGTLAVVWSQLRSGGSGDAMPTEPNLAVVDVASGEVRVVRNVRKRIWTARIDAEGVYLLTLPSRAAGNKSLMEVLRLNVDDLTLAGSAEIPVESSSGGPQFFAAVDSKVLVAFKSNFSLPELNETLPKIGVQGSWPAGNSGQELLASPLGKGWQWEGMVWNEQLSEPTLLLEPLQFVGSTPTPRNGRMSVWGRQVVGRGVEVSPGNNLIQSGNYQPYPVVSDTVAAAFLLRPNSEINGKQAATIEIYDLVSGREAGKIVLIRGERMSSDSGQQAHEDVIATAGNILAACVNNKLFLVPLAELNSFELPKPLHFRLAQSPLLLDRKSNAIATYELLDGEPPYNVTVSIGEYRVQEKVSDEARLSIDGRLVAANLLDQFHTLRWPWASSRIADPRQRVVDYIEKTTPAFQALTGRSPTGVVVIVPVTVEAIDKRMQVAHLSHAFLMELQSGRVVERLTDPPNNYVNPYRERRRQDSGKTSDLAQAAETARQQRLAVLDRDMAVDYARQIRKANPRVEIDDDRFERQAAEARRLSDSILARHVRAAREARMLQQRTWSDRKNHTTEARLKTVFADQVTLLLSSGNEVTVPIEKLSDADQQFIQEFQERSDLSQDDHMYGRMKFLMEAMARHVRREKRYPPAFIVGEGGNALLSWRVALLPDLGAKDLYALFHFDEPWDSQHNRRLLDYMPAVFASPEKKLPASKTPLLAFRGKESVLSDGRPLSPREIKDPTARVVVLSEVVDSRAVPWTEPADLSESEFTKLRELLRERDGRFFVGLASYTVDSLPVTTTAGQWKEAIDHSDRKP